MNPNEMTDPKAARLEKRAEALAEANARKGAYRRLMQNPDFQIFYNYLETCYNSYMESVGSAQISEEMKRHLATEAAFIHKTFAYLDRQTKN